MGGNGIKGIFQEIGILLFASCQIKVNQIGGRMITHRVPIFPRFVTAQRLRMGAEGNRVNVGVEATLFTVVFKVAIKQVNRRFNICHNLRITRNPIGLGRPCQRIDLLIARNGIIIVAKLRGKDLLLGAVVFDINSVIPIANALTLILEAQMLPQIVSTLSGCFQAQRITRQQVR